MLLSSEFPPAPGGIGRHCHQLAQGLTRLGHEILVLAPQDYSSEEEMREFNGRQPFEVRTLHHSTLKVLEGIARYRALRKAALTWKPDVLVATGERSVWLAAALRSKAFARVAIGHGSEFTVRSRWREALTRRSFSRMDSVVSVSDFTRSRMRSLGIRPSRDSVIPNGGDPSLFYPIDKAEAANLRQHLRIDGHMLLTVGNVTARKGQDLVISALPHIPDVIGKVHYVCVGIPSERARLELLAERLGVSDQVHFLGRMDDNDLVRAYNACDLFTMTSRSTEEGDVEGFGIAVIEAALCGKPAVVTEGSGLTEAIAPGETGLVAKREDAVDIAAKVARLLSDQELRLRLGAQARERALRAQTWESAVEVYERVLEEAGRHGFCDGTASLGRLVIVSHTPHYEAKRGVVGWGPTVREIDHLAQLFDAIVHIAPLSAEDAPASALPYTSNRVRLCGVRASGGEHLRNKIGILLRAPSYLSTTRRVLKGADVVHVRCPANISLLALLLLTLKWRPRCRWIKYAGNWKPTGSEPLSYRFQRWWLRHNLVRGIVTVNGQWPNQPSHVRTFMNPCLTEAELAEARYAAIRKALGGPIQLLFVGRVEEAKGIRIVVEVAAELERQGVRFSLDVVGDGPARSRFELGCKEQGFENRVHWHGWEPRPRLGELYAEAHLLLVPSSTEGLPKTIGEAMAYGVVPLASDISAISQILSQAGTGMALPTNDPSSYSEAIKGYLSEPDRWFRESRAAAAWAPRFTYDRYIGDVRSLVGGRVEEITGQ